jgi:hypothetical protein
MTKDEVLETIQRANLGHLISDLEPLLCPGLRIGVRAVPEEVLVGGGSKIGGAPDLPLGTPWPEWKGLPLQFLAQFALEEMTAYPLGAALPAAGLLSFFLAPTWIGQGQPADPAAWQVLFTGPQTGELHQRRLPAHFPAEYLYLLQPHALSYEGTMTLPALEAVEGPSRARLAVEAERYAHLLLQLQPSFGHPLLGHPHPLQGGAMSYWCALEERQLAYPDLSLGKLEALAKEAAGEWRLLLQLDELVNPALPLGGDLGGDGVFYFWIRHQALLAGDFSQVWLQYQCT